MKSCLPNKLIMIRKHFNYSQQDVAKVLEISVNDYMAFENGSAMMSMDQLFKLSELYSIRFDEMFLNSTDINLPVIEKVEEEEDDVIPYVAESEIAREMGLEKTRVNNVVFDENPDEYTRIQDLEHTTVTRIVKDDPNPNGPKEKNKNLPLIIGAVAVVLVLGIIAFLFMNGKRSNAVLNEIGKENRLVATENYSAYLKNNGVLKVYGDNVELDFDDVVQISGYDDYMLGLTDDGQIVVSDSKHDINAVIEDFGSVSMIAAGKDHVVALLQDGTVACNGNEQACKVEEWKDIDKVYAGKDATFGLGKAGTLFVAGSATYLEDMDEEVNVAKVVANDTSAAVLYRDGSVKVFGAHYDTENWLGMTSVALGDDFVVGLKNDGSLAFDGNTELKEAADSFTNVTNIAAYKDYYIAVIDNKVYGAGEKTNNQFSDISATEKLATVENFEYSIGAKKVSMTWDEVEGADYYEVSIDTTPNSFEIKSASANYSIDTSKFNDGSTYYVTIVAYSDNKEVQCSDEATFTLLFEANLNQLDKVTNIRATETDGYIEFTWDAVADATGYNVSIEGLGGFEKVVSDTRCEVEVSKFSLDTKYKVKVVAIGNNTIFDSEPAIYEYSYSKQKLANTKGLDFKYEGEVITLTWKAVDFAAAYSVSVNDKVATTTSETSWVLPVGQFNYGDELKVSFVAKGSQGYSDSDIQVFVFQYGSKEETVQPTKTYTVRYMYETFEGATTIWTDQTENADYVIKNPDAKTLDGLNIASISTDPGIGSSITLTDGTTDITVTGINCNGGTSFSGYSGTYKCQ